MDSNLTPGLTPDQQSVISASNQMWNARRKQIVEEEYQQRRENASLGDYLLDVPTGVLAGAEGFVNSVGKLGDDIAEAMGGDLADDSSFEQTIRPVTLVGDLTKGVTQFALAFVPVAGVAGRVSKAAELGRAGTIGLNMAAGAVADFTAFQGHEERLSNLVQDWPILGNPVTKYLAASEEDTDAEGRFKNALEGMGLGLASEVLSPILRAFKKVKVAPTKEAATSAWAEAQEAVAKSAKVARYRDTVLSLTNNVTAEQVDSTFALWAKIARQKGKTLDEFLDERLAGIVNAEDAQTDLIAKRLEVAETPKPVDPSPLPPKTPASVSGLEVEKAKALASVESPLDMSGPTSFGHSSATDVRGAGITPGVFNQNANGWVRFVNDTQALLGLSKTADVSTLLHESFHVWRRYDLEPSTLKALEKAVGVGADGWTREMEEKAARLFERYLYNGIVPDGASPALFGKFKEWMGTVYRSLGGSPIEGDVSPEVSKAFGKIFEGDSKPLVNSADEVDGARRPLTDFLLQRNASNTVPQEAVDAFHTTFVANRGSGLQDADALAASLETHINTARLRTSDDHKTFVMNAMKLIDEWNFKGVDEVQKLKMVEDGARDYFERYGADVQGVLGQAARDVKKMDPAIQKRFVFYKMAANRWGEDLRVLVSSLPATPTKEAVDAVTEKWKAVASLRHMIDYIQTQGARLPSVGRIVTGIEDVKIEAKMAKVKDVLLGGDDAAKARVLTSIQAAGDDLRAFDRVLDFFDGKGKGAFKKFLDIHLEYWMNAILSGVKTHGANVLNNMTQTILMPAERVAGGVWMRDKTIRDSGFRLYANLVQTSLDMFHMTEAGMRINPDGALGGAVKSFREDRPLIDSVTKEAIPRAISAKNLGIEGNPYGQAVDWIGKAVNLPSRLLTSTDDFFKQINVRAYLRDKAMGEALSKGLEKDSRQFSEYVTEYVAKAFDKDGAVLDEAAREYGRQATFTTELIEGTLGKTLQGIAEKHPALRLFVPFIRTPTNIFRRMVQYTPGINFLQGEYREMWRHPDPVIRASARGRLMLGGLFWGSTVGMALSGKLTGGGPTNAQERNALLATGWRPYSFVFTDSEGKKEYISYQRLDPNGMILGLAADFAEIGGSLEDQDAGAIASAMSMALAKNLTSKTYLTGISEVVNVLSQPDHYGKKFIENRIGTYVPNILAQLNNDENLRETRGLLDAVKRRLPGFSDSLPPRRNLLGEAITPTGGWLPFAGGSDAARMVSPLAYSKSVNDPVKDEMARLSHGFTPPQTKVAGFDLRQIVNGSGQDAYDYWQEQHGKVKIGGKTLAETLNKLVTSKQYQAIDPELNSDQRVSLIQGVLGQYREAAKDQMLKAYPEVTKRLRDFQRARSTPATSPILERLKAAS